VVRAVCRREWVVLNLGAGWEEVFCSAEAVEEVSGHPEEKEDNPRQTSPASSFESVPA
jgi:hypothetical protein